MKTSCIVFVLLMSLLIAIPRSSLAGPLSADDFLPLAQASDAEKQEASQIQTPDAVKQTSGFGGQSAIEAASAQDAINAASAKMVESGSGCEQIKFPSGFGWVASATEVYSFMENPVAALSVQRLAYQRAFLQAKKNLAQAMHGLSTEGKEQMVSEMKSLVSGTDSLANSTETSRESITESVNGLLKGFVVYSVNDDQKKSHGEVTVTIVTTPKTQGSLGRPDASSLTAESVRDGLNHVLAELSSGLMPPIGGRTISVPQTGELAFVAYGSAIVMQNSNPAVQAKMKLEAQKIAGMRARSALCGIILGEEISASSSLEEETRQSLQEFEEMQAEDPVNDKASPEYQKLQEQKQAFLQTMITKEKISSLRSGILPPGVSMRSYFNDAGTMAEAVAVYLPSMSQAAAAAGKTMQDAQLVSPTVQGGGSSVPLDTSTGIDSGSVPPRGVSGQISHDADL